MACALLWGWRGRWEEIANADGLLSDIVRRVGKVHAEGERHPYSRSHCAGVEHDAGRFGAVDEHVIRPFELRGARANDRVDGFGQRDAGGKT